MTTPQEIREITFEKAVFGGYDMNAVDQFLDQIANDFTALAKENANLKGKMKVLVDKIEEYRQTEDSMRLALLSAQKMSAQIEADARQKADHTVVEAKAYAASITREAENAIANEQAKLVEAKRASQKFIDHMRTVCQKQISFYDALADMQLIAPEDPEEDKQADVAETVRSIADNAEKTALEEPEPPIDLSEELAEPDEPTRHFMADGKKKKRSPAVEFHHEQEN